MKHLITLASFATLTITAEATVHIVTCQNGDSHFLPVTVNAIIGDTIHWTWVSGNHIVGPIYETDIPVGADTWNAWIDATHPTFDYVVAYAGNYHYVCHPQTPHGEDGFIVVSTTTAVQPSAPTSGSTLLYPNPFSEQLTLEATGANSMTIHNLLGEEVVSFALISGTAELRADLGTLPKGIYFCSILRDGVVLETRRLVKQ